MKFIFHNGVYFRPEAVAMISEDKDNEKEEVYFRPEAFAMISEDKDNEKGCVVHLFDGQKIFLPRPAEFTANFIAKVANGEIEADVAFDNPDGVTSQVAWHDEYETWELEDRTDEGGDTRMTVKALRETLDIDDDAYVYASVLDENGVRQPYAIVEPMSYTVGDDKKIKAIYLQVDKLIQSEV